MRRLAPSGERPMPPTLLARAVLALVTVAVMAVLVMTMLVMVVFLRAARFPPGLIVSIAAPGAAPLLRPEIVVIIFSRHVCKSSIGRARPALQPRYYPAVRVRRYSFRVSSGGR
jgi:hypothetical protein